MMDDDFCLVGGKYYKIVLCPEANGRGFFYECDVYPDCGKFRFLQEDSPK